MNVLFYGVIELKENWFTCPELGHVGQNICL